MRSYARAVSTLGGSGVQQMPSCGSAKFKLNQKLGQLSNEPQQKIKNKIKLSLNLKTTKYY